MEAAKIHTSKIKALLIFIGSSLLVQCTHNGQQNHNPEKITHKNSYINAATIVPHSFPLSPPGVSHPVKIPKNLLQIAMISRQRAELRVGPASYFKLKNQYLTKGQKVILFNRHGSWQKVVSIDQSRVGWLHHKTVGKTFLNKEDISIDPKALPTVFSVRAVKKAFDFPNSKKISIYIPKGRAFIALNMNKRRTLVWLKETNSVLWLDKQDAH